MHKQQTGNGIPFPDEIDHLVEVERKLEEAIEDAASNVDRLDTEYRDAKRYMVEYRGEIDPHEMFQNELLVRQTDQTVTIAVGVLDRLLKLRESPSRIDFRYEEGDQPEAFYIGRFTFSHENELLVFDWRAPVAGMFYDYEVGPAGYDAPLGRIDGALTRKRQFKISNGVMEYVIESEAHVQDDTLQRELAHNADKKMKSIIATIQKEQNRIIRNEKTETLLIQGVAGSDFDRSLLYIACTRAMHRLTLLYVGAPSRLLTGGDGGRGDT